MIWNASNGGTRFSCYRVYLPREGEWGRYLRAANTLSARPLRRRGWWKEDSVKSVNARMLHGNLGRYVAPLDRDPRPGRS